MKLAFVIPLLARTGGNKVALSLAEELVDQGDHVELFVHTASSTVLPQLPEFTPGVPLKVLRTRTGGFRGHWDPIVWNVATRRNRELALLIAQRHREVTFDAVILISNEGRTLARELRKILGRNTPKLGWCVMELIDHIYLLRRERDLGWLRTISFPIYPLIHELWSQAFLEYDFLLANSPWTSDLLGYLYGLNCLGEIISLPRCAFTHGPPWKDSMYVAVPTVSLGPKEIGMLDKIARSGLPLVAYGPRPLPSSIPIPHKGFLSEDGMRELLSNAAATLFLFDYEALGLVPLESLAAGTPVITFPKQGPHRTLAGNPDVHFGRNIQELATLCRRMVMSPPTESDRARCKLSVERYSSPRAAQRFHTFLGQVT